MMQVQVSWFEIPVSDLDRAIEFYQTVFQISLKRLDLGQLQMALFSEKEGSGALVQHPEFYVPSTAGVLLHLQAEPNLAHVLERVEPCGGQVLIPKRQISAERGFMAVFLDSEGNRLALHSSR